MSTLERAIELAVTLHRGQQDKAGMPYVLHPLRLMLRMSSPAAMMAAVLHDTVEDTPLTLEQLRQEGFAEEVVSAVDALTRRADETYEQFVERAGAHPIARQVKRADLEDNMQITRLAELADKDVARMRRYLLAWRALADD